MSYTLREKLIDQINYHWFVRRATGGGECGCGRQGAEPFTNHLADVVLATTNGHSEPWHGKAQAR